MPSLSTIRLLVIDDDADDRKLVLELLADAKRAQFIVDGVDSGKAGLEALSKARYDVVFVDYKLLDPEFTGIDTLKQIVALHYGVPVVIVTSLNDKDIQARAVEAGAAEFLEKGRFNTDILERTCLYVIGLHEKATKNGSGPGVSVLMEQLVSLTRDGIRAQTEATQETREFRRELASGVKSLADQITTHGGDCKTTHAAILTELADKNTPKGKWLLDWIAGHPVIALALLMVLLALLVTIAALAVILLEHISTDKIKALQGATGFLKDGDPGVLRLWIG